MGKGMKWRTDATRKKMRRQGTRSAKDEGGPQSRRSFRVLRQPGEPCPRCGLPTQFHNRMPVIIAPADYERWLSEEPDPRDLLKPFPPELMTMWPITTRVNRPANDEPSILDPVTE